MHLDSDPNPNPGGIMGLGKASEWMLFPPRVPDMADSTVEKRDKLQVTPLSSLPISSTAGNIYLEPDHKHLVEGIEVSWDALQTMLQASLGKKHELREAVSARTRLQFIKVPEAGT